MIVEFNGKDVEDWNDLPRLVAATPVDERVKVVVIRDGARETLRARIGVLEEPAVKVAKVSGSPGAAEEFPEGDTVSVGL